MSHEIQPRTPKLLSFTELWERFGFYTLQTIIILYMTKALAMPDTKAYLLYGTFGAMLCLAPILGGHIVEKYLGVQRAILIGGALFILGYLLTAIVLSLGLAVIVVANGLFKPNTGESASSRWIYFAFLVPPLLTGLLVKDYGWHSGFLLAAFGMFAGIAAFVLGKSHLRSFGGLPAMSPLHRKEGALKFHALFYLGVLLAIGILLFLFQFPEETVILISIAALGFALFRRFREISVLITVGCLALYSQTFTSLMLYAERSMSRDFFGFAIEPELTLIFPPLFALLLSPFLTRFRKSTMAILFMAMGYLLLGIGENTIYWLIGSYLLQTIGMLLLSSPLSMNARFLVQAAAAAMGGALAALSSVPSDAAAEAALKIYNHAFFMYGGVALGLFGLSLALSPYLRRQAIPR